MSNRNLTYSIGQIISKGDRYYDLGKFNEALYFYNQVLNIDEDNVILLCKNGNTYLQLGKKNKAYDFYFSAL